MFHKYLDSMKNFCDKAFFLIMRNIISKCHRGFNLELMTYKLISLGWILMCWLIYLTCNTAKRHRNLSDSKFFYSKFHFRLETFRCLLAAFHVKKCLYRKKNYAHICCEAALILNRLILLLQYIFVFGAKKCMEISKRSCGKTMYQYCDTAQITLV